jgi:hypothetical protein
LILALETDTLFECLSRAELSTELLRKEIPVKLNTRMLLITIGGACLFQGAGERDAPSSIRQLDQYLGVQLAGGLAGHVQ